MEVIGTPENETTVFINWVLIHKSSSDEVHCCFCIPPSNIGLWHLVMG
jgi:hypothetical protein